MIPANFSPPTPETTESMVALAEARRRVAAPEYEPGAALERKKMELEEQRQGDVQELYRRAGIPEDTWGIDIMRTIPAEGRDFLECKREAHRHPKGLCVVEGNWEAIEFMQGWKLSAGSVWLSGETGRGKSMLASAVVQRLMDQPNTLRWGYGTTAGGNGPTEGLYVSGGAEIFWTSEADLVADEESHRRHREKGVSPYDRAMSVELLVANEFLTNVADKPPWKQAEARADWERIIGKRVERELVTIFTSNQPLSGVEKRSKRLHSRIHGMCGGASRELGGPDWREYVLEAP